MAIGNSVCLIGLREEIERPDRLLVREALVSVRNKTFKIIYEWCVYG